MENIYENYSLKELEYELAQVRAIVYVSDAQKSRKEARERKIEKEINSRRDIVTPQPEYTAEMTIIFGVGKASMSKFMDALSLMLSNPYITTESVIISKKE